MGKLASWVPWTPWSTASAGRDTDCRCKLVDTADRVLFDATACPHAGVLSDSPACRATVVEAIPVTEPTPISVRRLGLERRYQGRASRLLHAASDLSVRLARVDDHVVDLVRTDPLRAATDVADRAGPVHDAAADCGLLEIGRESGSYGTCFRPTVGPPISDARLRPEPPADARLVDRRRLSTEAEVRIFDRPDAALPVYHLTPVELRVETATLERIDRAADLLRTGAVAGEDARQRAARRVADSAADVATVGAVLRKHTTDLGILVDCFADPSVSDVFATAPVPENPLRVRVDGDLAETNVYLTHDGVRALAAGFRRQSGRAFSRAEPTLDATTTAGDRRVRVAGLCEPVSDGYAFAFRAADRRPWTVDRLVANGTLPPFAAALLTLAVERAAAMLVAGPRGAGKTTLLGALCHQIPSDTRTVVLEDTPELPVEVLQASGRDVQGLLTESGAGPGLPPAEALRTALRLGEGTLVVGEVRGPEAAVLYEAMRVGASGSAVLGTIHGDGGAAILERVVSDLDVPASSFAATDLVVTLERTPHGRRLAAIEEVGFEDDAVHFAPLVDCGDGPPRATGRVERGNSTVVSDLAESGETYADVLDAIRTRTDEYRARTTHHGATSNTV